MGRDCNRTLTLQKAASGLPALAALWHTFDFPQESEFSDGYTERAVGIGLTESSFSRPSVRNIDPNRDEANDAHREG